MNKRGQSNIITTVLLVLVALAAVAVIAGFIINQVIENRDRAEMMAKVSDITLEKVYTMEDSKVKIMRFAIRKLSESQDLEGIKGVITYDDGTTSVHEIPINDFQVLEIKEEDIPITEKSKEIKKFEIYPIFKYKNKVIYGNVLAGWIEPIKNNPKCYKTPIQGEEQDCEGLPQTDCGSGEYTTCEWSPDEEYCQDHPECLMPSSCEKPLGCNYGNFEPKTEACTFDPRISGNCQNSYEECTYSAGCSANWNSDSNTCTIGYWWWTEYLTGICSSEATCVASAYETGYGCSGTWNQDNCGYTNPETDESMYNSRCNSDQCSSEWGCGSSWVTGGICTGNWIPIKYRWVCPA